MKKYVSKNTVAQNTVETKRTNKNIWGNSIHRVPNVDLEGTIVFKNFIILI